MAEAARDTVEELIDGMDTLQVLQQLAITNGVINRMRKAEVVSELSQRGLSTSGNKKVLSQRLKRAVKVERLGEQRSQIPTCQATEIPPSRVDYLCVIDFEATCEEGEREYPHEIIEFPVVLVDVAKQKIVDSCRWYCKPSLNPELTEFCTGLTGITQRDVDQADDFVDVLEHFNTWLDDKGLGTDHTFAIATDGPWDIRDFMYLQTRVSSIEMPEYCKHWVNLRKHFQNFYKQRGNVAKMLRTLGMSFEGREHCGLDDAQNIARIAVKMLEDGVKLTANETLSSNQKRLKELKMRIRKAKESSIASR